MLHTLLVYDISDDRIRTKIATLCADYGLDRIQYSAFYGRLRRTHQEELMQRVGRLLRKNAGKVQLISIGQSEWERRIEIENGGTKNG
jgi:CRISPR-associated protein Cas2